MSETQPTPGGPQTGAQSLDTATRPTWCESDPLMVAIAVAVWEQCETDGSSTVADDPRTIAAIAATTARQVDADRAHTADPKEAP